MLATAATVAIIAVAWLVRALVDPALPSGFPYVTFFPAVIVTSFLFGIRLGTATPLSAACWPGISSYRRGAASC